MSFFHQGDGLAIAAALEDETYPLDELIYDLANLDAGFRFCGDDNRWDGRLALVCHERYKLQSIPGYLESYEVEEGGTWSEVAAPAGELALPAGGVTVRAQVSSDKAREVVLRLGSGCGLAVKLNGKPVFQRSGGRTALPDTDAVLVRLREGDNLLEIRLRGDGDPVLFARISGPRGLPVAGVSAR